MHPRFPIIHIALALFIQSSALAQDGGAIQCRVEGTAVTLDGLSEASGVAASRRQPGRYWTHNDSGDPTIVALDANGGVSARLQVSGAAVEDWEAVAVGPCDGGSCIYIGDIGDNEAKRDRITVYRVPEPATPASSVTPDAVFHATYPDGAHDAETLLVGPDGRLAVVTKGDTGAVALYRFPRDAKPGATVRLERVGEPLPNSANGDGKRRITDGDVSPDGRWVVLRSTTDLTWHRAPDFFAGNWAAAGRVDLRPLGERQGEGVTFSGDGRLALVGEGGGQKRAGTFTRLACEIPTRTK